MNHVASTRRLGSKKRERFRQHNSLVTSTIVLFVEGSLVALVWRKQYVTIRHILCRLVSTALVSETHVSIYAHCVSLDSLATIRLVFRLTLKLLIWPNLFYHSCVAAPCTKTLGLFYLKILLGNVECKPCVLSQNTIWWEKATGCYCRFVQTVFNFRFSYLMAQGDTESLLFIVIGLGLF